MINVDIENQLISRVAETLMFLKKEPNSNVRKISRDLNIDYNYVSKIIVRCEEKGLIKTKFETREKLVSLTEKGIEMASHFDKLKEMI